jgi:hypothetical protein
MMTLTDYLLVLIMEEANEVAHRASKALRFGLNEIQPGQTETNGQRMVHEMIDLAAVSRLLEERGSIAAPADFDERFDGKISRIKKYIDRARAEGRLEPGASQ